MRCVVSTEFYRRLKPPADLRRMSRWLLAVLLPVGPAAVAVQRFVLPYRTTEKRVGCVAA